VKILKIDDNRATNTRAMARDQAPKKFFRLKEAEMTRPELTLGDILRQALTEKLRKQRKVANSKLVWIDANNPPPKTYAVRSF
jgi:hypothetical protein